MDKKEEVVAPCKGEKGLSSYYLNEEWKNYSWESKSTMQFLI